MNKKIKSEKAERNYQLNLLIKKLQTVTNKNTKYMFRDDNWSNVYDFIDKLYINGIKNINMSSGVYYNYLPSVGSNYSPYRLYKLNIDTIYGELEAELTCSAAGPMNNPFSMYDITCIFWKKQN